MGNEWWGGDEREEGRSSREQWKLITVHWDICNLFLSDKDRSLDRSFWGLADEEVNAAVSLYGPGVNRTMLKEDRGWKRGSSFPLEDGNKQMNLRKVGEQRLCPGWLYQLSCLLVLSTRARSGRNNSRNIFCLFF